MEKFVVFIDKVGDWRYNLKAPNGEIIQRCVTGYSCKRNVLRGIASVKKWNKKVYFRKKKGTKYGVFPFWTFTQCAPNGKAIGTSETYTSNQGRNNGINLVIEYAPTAEIVYDL